MKQLFLIDESLSSNLTKKLSQLGYNSKSVREINLKGFDDIKIIEWAIKNDAVIVTGDLDFGELWYWYYHGKIGVIVLRLKSYRLEEQYKVIKFLHDNKIFNIEKIRTSLVVSTSSKYRIRIR